MNRFDLINAEDQEPLKRTRRKRTRMTVKKLKEPTPVEPPKSFEDKLRDNDYTSKLPWPRIPSRGRAGENRSTLVNGAMRQRDAYHHDEAQLHEDFKADMFAHYGVTGHPKAQRAFEIAWSHGHSAGFAEVDIYFSELAELLQP